MGSAGERGRVGEGRLLQVFCRVGDETGELTGSGWCKRRGRSTAGLPASLA